MTKITQKNYEAIVIYRQKEKLFELKGKIQTLEAENTKLKTDCRTLAQKLLQVKPELREWLETNYGEYL